jgi:hypothetical protein
MMVKLALDSPQDPSWFLFLAAACFIAWVSGVVLGDFNYHYNMEPYYDVRTLNTYPNVDPRMSGQTLMDAGRMTFRKGSTIGFNYSVAFKNLDTYCVAPVVMNQTGSLPTYDFWAVGLNCCSGDRGSFNCGEYNNPHAMSGLRVMRDEPSSFYRLAVQKAEASYNIHAPHPMFLYWMQDPVAEMHAYMDEGYKYYICGVFTFFAAMLFFVMIAIILFSRVVIPVVKQPLPTYEAHWEPQPFVVESPRNPIPIITSDRMPTNSIPIVTSDQASMRSIPQTIANFMPSMRSNGTTLMPRPVPGSLLPSMGPSMLPSMGLPERGSIPIVDRFGVRSAPSLGYGAALGSFKVA